MHLQMLGIGEVEMLDNAGYDIRNKIKHDRITTEQRATMNMFMYTKCTVFTILTKYRGILICKQNRNKSSETYVQGKQR